MNDPIYQIYKESTESEKGELDPTGNNYGFPKSSAWRNIRKIGDSYFDDADRFIIKPYQGGWHWHNIDRPEDVGNYYFSGQDPDRQYYHRLDGPALIYTDGEYKFYINGKEYPEKEYWILVKKFKPEDRQEALDLLDI